MLEKMEVQDENRNNLLAIEFDGKVYNSSKNVRQRDFDRSSYSGIYQGF